MWEPCLSWCDHLWQGLINIMQIKIFWMSHQWNFYYREIRRMLPSFLIFFWIYFNLMHLVKPLMSKWRIIEFLPLLGMCQLNSANSILNLKSRTWYIVAPLEIHKVSALGRIWFFTIQAGKNVWSRCNFSVLNVCSKTHQKLVKTNSQICTFSWSKKLRH